MGSAKPCRSSVSIPWIPFITLLVSNSVVFASEPSLIVGECTKLEVSPSLKVVNSPGIKPESSVLCERVRINGLARLINLDKFSHSLKLKLLHPSSSTLRRPSVEVCFHRNVSLGIGMCPQGKWEKVEKGSWVRAMSPFDHKLLDIRMGGSSSENLELSLEEEFFLYRVIFLVLGVVMLSVASTVSKSLIFYYSGAMVIGILLVILVVLFQGMKLLPTGRRSSLAIFIYSSIVGVGTFLLRYLPGLFQSILVELGVSEDMYYPVFLDVEEWLVNNKSFRLISCLYAEAVIRWLTTFLLAFVVLAGAYMGFWAVRKLVLTDDGSVDISTSHFVAWAIRIFAVVMILQSSLDPLLAAEALIAGIMASSVLRRIFRLRFWRRVYKKVGKLVKNMNRESDIPNLSLFGSPYDDEYVVKRHDNSKFRTPQPKRFNLASCNSTQGFSKTPPRQISDSDVFPSTFHATPERPKYSKDVWEKFTKDSTQKAVQELVSSPDFNKWVAANADRITVTPSSSSSASKQRRKWFLWS